jgi:hypothetical protein
MVHDLKPTPFCFIPDTNGELFEFIERSGHYIQVRSHQVEQGREDRIRGLVPGHTSSSAGPTPAVLRTSPGAAPYFSLNARQK